MHKKLCFYPPGNNNFTKPPDYGSEAMIYIQYHDNITAMFVIMYNSVKGIPAVFLGSAQNDTNSVLQGVSR